MPGRFTLNKKQRLKSRKSIEELFSAGQTIVSGQLKAFYKLTTSGLQFGAGVSAKNFKKSVDRNKVKRLLRESWRLQKNNLEESLSANNKGLNVFVLYTGKELPEYKIICTSTGELLQKLLKITG
jgi:ribonuclease P protein component